MKPTRLQRYWLLPLMIGTALALMSRPSDGHVGMQQEPSRQPIPDSGTIDEIPVESHFLIDSNLNPAATAEMPTDQRILSRCGTYLFVTKDRSIFQKLNSIVESWTIDAEQGADDQLPARAESRTD